MSTAVFGIVKTVTDAEVLVQSLQTLGRIPARDISVLLPDKSGTRDFAHEHNTKAPEGAAVGASTGGVAGGVLGLLAGIGALAIPGVGPLIAAGPIMAALSGAAVGAAVGGIAGSLIGLGIPEFEAKRFEKRINDGNILVSVHAEVGDDKKRVLDIFKTAGVEDVTTTREKSEVA